MSGQRAGDRVENRGGARVGAMRLHAVIPTHNAPAERLRRAIASVLACDLVERVWVVDDGSDVPVEVLGAVGSPLGELLVDERVEVLVQANSGPSAARNTGLDSAGDVDAVLLLDDDDELIASSVRAILELADGLGASAVVSGREHVWAADGRTETRPVPAAWADAALPDGSDVFTPIGLFGASGCLVADPALREGVRFDREVWHGEDRDFLRRCSAHGPIGVCSEIALRVSMHEKEARNLCSSEHLSRRVRDHLVLMNRHYESSHEAQWREATLWLVNQISKARGETTSADELLAACARRRWKVPMKTRARLLRQRLFHAESGS